MKYIFIHIGKTAGTSFRSFLQANIRRPYWGYGKLCFLTDARDKNKFIEAEPEGMSVFKQYDLFSEHFIHGLHPYLGTKDYQYLSVLREPVSRTISAYRYGIDRGWVDKNLNILEWFGDGGDQKYYQLNHIAGVPEDVGVDVKMGVAIKNLMDDKFLFGFTEKYNEFIDLCCEINGWEPSYRTTNVTQSKNTVTEEEKERLRELLKEEIQFYNEAVNVYNEKYKKN